MEFYQRVMNRLNARPHVRSVCVCLSYYNDHRSRVASRIISIVRARLNGVSWLVGALNESLVLTNHSMALQSIGQDICQHHSRGTRLIFGFSSVSENDSLAHNKYIMYITAYRRNIRYTIGYCLSITACVDYKLHYAPLFWCFFGSRAITWILHATWVAQGYNYYNYYYYYYKNAVSVYTLLSVTYCLTIRIRITQECEKSKQICEIIIIQFFFTLR